MSDAVAAAAGKIVVAVAKNRDTAVVICLKTILATMAIVAENTIDTYVAFVAEDIDVDYIRAFTISNINYLNTKQKMPLHSGGHFMIIFYHSDETAEKRLQK